MRHRVHQEIFFYTCLLLVFFLPVFPRVVPGIILLMSANWLFSGSYIKTVPLLFKDKLRLSVLSFAAIYFLYLAGMLWSTDFDYGWFDLEVKLSILAFPLIFSTSDLSIFTKSRIKLIFGSYIIGCLAGSLILIVHAWINHRTGMSDAFYYTNLAWYFHSSYLAMYLTFGISMLLYIFLTQLSGSSFIKITGLSLLILYFEGFIFLLSSKAGLIVLAATEILFILLLMTRKIRMNRIILIAFLMAVAFTGYSRIFPFAFKRIAKADSAISSSGNVKANPDDGTVARMEIWKISLGLIRQNFLFGVGTGDVKDTYLQAYQEKNLSPIFRKQLNAHNQYLQTFVALGMIGFSLLAAMLIIPSFMALRKRNLLYFAFLLIFTINILFESMLETQAGVVFYAFFNAFLFSTWKEDI
jgi:O-antigen ligase